MTCAPCSYYYRSLGGQKAQRYTYCSTRSPNPQVLCFREETTSGQPQQDVSTTSFDLKSRSHVVHLDVVQGPTIKDDEIGPLHLIAVHADGQVLCLTSSLDNEVWRRSTCQQVAPDRRNQDNLRYAALLSEEETVKSILNGREDAVKSASLEGLGGRSVLLTIGSRSEETDNSNEFEVSLHALEASEASYTELSGKRPLTKLLSQKLPVPANMDKANSSFSFHPLTGTLYQSHATGSAIYALRNFTPKLLHVLRFQGARSCMRLSSHLLATASDTSLELVELPYGSLQASIQLQNKATEDSLSKATSSRRGIPRAPTTRLISSSKQHDLVVALVGAKLVGIPISREQNITAKSRKRNREGMLISSLGRKSLPGSLPVIKGPVQSPPSGFGEHIKPQARDPAWQKRTVKLDGYLEQREFSAFEKVVLDELDPHTFQSIPARQQIISYVLCRLFQVSQTATNEGPYENGLFDQLRVNFWVDSVCQWLITQGLLAHEQIEWSQKDNGIIPSWSKLAGGNLVKALVDWDPRLSILHKVLASPSSLEPTDLANAFLAITKRWKALDWSHQTLLLTHQQNQIDNNAPSAMQVEKKPTNQLALINGKSSDGHEKRLAKQALYSALRRQKALDSKSMARAFKQTLSNSEMRSLVDILRIELAENGWLSLCSDDLQVHIQEARSDDQITLIAHTLNILLDALGPTGWMLGHSSSHDVDDTADTISYMKAEVSAALEGIEEATYLRQLLSEMLLHGKETLLQISNGAAKRSGRGNTFIQPVKPQLVVQDPEDNLLPLGLRRTDIPKMKIGAGGEIKQRSQRDIGRLRSKQVSKYSFERIEI